MNLAIIGNDIDDIGLDIWKANTNYIVLNRSPYMFDATFDKFVKNRDYIVCTTSEQIESKEVDFVIESFIKHDIIPIFIADNKDSIETKMYVGVEDYIPSALLYIKNKEKKDYQELIKIAQGYLLGKGIIKNDNTIRAPRKRKRSTTEK